MLKYCQNLQNTEIIYPLYLMKNHAKEGVIIQDECPQKRHLFYHGRLLRVRINVCIAPL